MTRAHLVFACVEDRIITASSFVSEALSLQRTTPKRNRSSSARTSIGEQQGMKEERSGYSFVKMW